MNFQDTNQVMEMLDMNGQLRKLAQQLGIQDQNFEGFRRDMMNRFIQQSPTMAMEMYNEARPNLEQQ